MPLHFTDIAFICIEFIHITVHHLIHRFCVMHICRSHFRGDYSALMIHNQMQLKTIESTHRTFTSARQSRQGFIRRS